MEKRVVKEKNERHLQFKIAAAKKPVTPYINSHGLNPSEMRKNLVDKKTGQRTIVSRTPKTQSGRERPFKAVKSVNKLHNTTLIVGVPNAGTKLAIEYPTPKWFKFNGTPDVSVIVPIYKSQIVINDLIDNWPLDNGDLRVELIFVDDCCPNNSKDAVLKAWSKRQKELNGRGVGKIIYNIENKGYGTACNTGAELAKGEYVIFLNADTQVTPGWVKPMIDLFEDKKVGIVGNLQIKQGGMWDGTIDSAGSEWTWASGSFVHIGRHSYKRQNLPMPWKPDKAPDDVMKVGEREMVTGCCIAMKREMFNYVGGFNPNYRVGYWEDAEICLAVRELGYKVMFQPKSVIYHKLSHTNSGGHEFHDFNKNYFFNKWVASHRLDNLVDDKRPHKPVVGTILLRRSGANGDVLVAASVASGLKRMYPNSKVVFCTDCKEVLKNNPYIDRVIDDTELSERLFQVYYNLDMVYEYRPYTNILDAYAETVGVHVADCKHYLHKEPVYETLPKDYVVIHPGRTGWVGRDWKHENFIEIAKKLLGAGERVVCVGRQAEGEIPCSLDLRGKTNVAQLAWVISKAKKFIGIDSFPMHVAQTFNIPGVCFFGCITPSTRLYNPNMKPIYAENLACLGCHHRKPTPCTVTNSCETVNQECISLVSIDQMWNKVSNGLHTNQ
jgi:GT2 family glycosyltransferase/ADP-heptose:LPS heptosyltransferase